MSQQLDDAMIMSLLAQEARHQGKTSMVAPGAALSLEKAYQEAEEKLRDCRVSLGVERAGLQRRISYCPHRGLILTDMTKAEHWKQVPVSVLATHRHMLLDLQAQRIKLDGNVSTQLVEANLDATAEALVVKESLVIAADPDTTKYDTRTLTPAQSAKPAKKKAVPKK